MMHTILVVDERPDSRYAVVRTLTAAGFDVRETATGRDALRLAQQQHPDVIVLDIDLQDTDGFEVVRQLRLDSSTKTIPVLHKTAVYRDAEHRRRGLAAGADDYLVEPFEPGALVAAVRRLLPPSSQ
jgi:DNA-binding response OmpR family regulator